MKICPDQTPHEGSAADTPDRRNVANEIEVEVLIEWLYLSSSGVSDRGEELVALSRSAKPAAIIGNALDSQPEDRSGFLKNQGLTLGGLGFAVFELDLRNYFGASVKLGALLNDMDVVWINGGNTFNLRRAMKYSGFDLLIKSALARDAIVYAGFNAAAAVATASRSANRQSAQRGDDGDISPTFA
jgi:dipeptidase E